MIDRKKTHKQIIFFICLIGVTFWFLLKDYEPVEIYTIFSKLKYQYAIIGLLLAFLYVICESISFKFIFSTLGQKIKFLNLIRYSFLGFYFSAITPSASGGQPMQIYYMKKDKIPYSQSSLAVLLCVMGYQISLITLFIFSIFLNYEVIFNQNRKIYLLLLLAIITNFLLLFFILGAIFSKRFFPKIISLLFNLLAKIKFIKNIENKKRKVNLIVEEYHSCSMLFKEKPILLFRIIAIYILQLCIRFSITYILALAMNINAENIIDFISLQAIILFCVSALPIPGGVGISETLYISLFSILVPTNLINTTAIVTQMITYYFPVIIAMFVLIYTNIKEKI